MRQAALSREQVRRYYDRLGTVLDWGDSFEGRAKTRAMGLLEAAPGQRVLQVGVGTGREHVRMQRAVAPDGLVAGVDISPVMLRLTRERAGDCVMMADASELPFRARSFERLFCAYMLDLLPDETLPLVLSEFRRVVKPNGRMVLLSMTEGHSAASNLLIAAWKLVYRLGPQLTGGCRPLRVAEAARRAGLEVIEDEFIVQMAFPSEVVVAVV